MNETTLIAAFISAGGAILVFVLGQLVSSRRMTMAADVAARKQNDGIATSLRDELRKELDRVREELEVERRERAAERATYESRLVALAATHAEEQRHWHASEELMRRQIVELQTTVTRLSLEADGGLRRSDG